jgi:uncharacterized protein YcaQ
MESRNRPTRTRETLSLQRARRIALAAQGFADPRPAGKVDRRHLRRVLDRIGLIQIDSVNVLVRSQELPLFARLGPHPRTLIPDATASRELFEYWVHEASHVPTAHHHLHRWKMEHAQRHMWRAIRTLGERRPGFVEEVFERVRDGGPVASGDLGPRDRPKGSWWDWDDSKMALEWLFWCGRLGATRRNGDFARVYDLPDRLIPAAVLSRATPPESEARKELLAMAARHLGIATFGDLADYHRQKLTPCRPLLRELVEEGRIVPVAVEGWREPGYLDPAAREPRSIAARALLSPFDPIVWNRDRAERLFGFRYRIEIYTPAPKRQYGYYVLPFLLGDQLVGRVDLKADRARSALVAHGAYTEPGVPAEAIAGELMEELVSMAGWLGLERVEVGPRGELSAALTAAALKPGGAYGSCPSVPLP